MNLTPAELTVLGMLIEQPRHGYDLEQVIEQRGTRQWTDIGFSSIYYLLSKLTQRGFIEPDGEHTGAKSRRTFRATTEGRQAATENARTLIVDARPTPLPFLVGLANLPLLSENDLTEALRQRLALVKERITLVETAQHAQSPLPRPAREIFSYTLNLLEAERSWLTARVQVPR